MISGAINLFHYKMQEPPADGQDWLNECTKVNEELLSRMSNHVMYAWSMLLVACSPTTPECSILLGIRHSN